MKRLINNKNLIILSTFIVMLITFFSHTLKVNAAGTDYGGYTTGTTYYTTARGWNTGNIYINLAKNGSKYAGADITINAQTTGTNGSTEQRTNNINSAQRFTTTSNNTSYVTVGTSSRQPVTTGLNGLTYSERYAVRQKISIKVPRGYRFSRTRVGYDTTNFTSTLMLSVWETGNYDGTTNTGFFTGDRVGPYSDDTWLSGWVGFDQRAVGLITRKTATGSNDGKYVRSRQSKNINFVPNQTTVSYNANNGTGTMSNQTVTYDTNTTLTANSFTNGNQTFIGWNTLANGHGTNYSNEQSVTTMWPTESTVNLYAQWGIAQGESGGCAWRINSAGKLSIYSPNGGTCTLGAGTYDEQREEYWMPWHGYGSQITSVEVQTGVSANTNAAGLFMDLYTATSIDVDNLNTTGVTNMSEMFEGCHSLTSLDLSNFDTSDVTDAWGMFQTCYALTELDLSGFNMSNIESASNVNVMFGSLGSQTNTGTKITINNTFDNGAYSSNYGFPWAYYAKEENGTLSSILYNRNDMRTETTGSNTPTTWVPAYSVTYDKNTGDSVTGTPNPKVQRIGTNVDTRGYNGVKTGNIFINWNTAANGSGTTFAKNAQTSTAYGAKYFTTGLTNGNVALYAQYEDATPPTVSDIGGGTTVKSDSQNLTLKCSDEAGVTAYYWGTTEPTSASSITTTTQADLTSLTSNGGLSKNVTSAGTYWLGCRDAAGNYAKKSITIRSYSVDNRLLTLAGTKASYTSGNYASASTATYVAKDGTSLTASNIYTIPTGASSSTFKGYNLAAASTSPATLTSGSTAITLNGNKTITMWFDRTEYTITVNSGANGSTKAETVTQTGNSATATAGGTASLTVRYGDTVKATATPSTGYSFTGYSGGYISGTTNPQTGAAVTANKTITGSFADTTAPTNANITSTNNVATSQTATLSCSDTVGVTGYYWGTSAPSESSTYTTVTSTQNFSTTKTVSNSGTYYLVCRDAAGNTSTQASKTFYKTTLTMTNGTVSPASVITMSGNSFNLPTPTATTGYTNEGNWYTNSTFTTGSKAYNTSYTPSSNSTLYSKAEKNKYTVKVKTVNGIGTDTKTVDYNDSETFTVRPKAGYGSGTVSCTNSQTGTLNGTTLTVSNVKNNTTCTVTYSPNSYVIKFNNNTGTGTMSNLSMTYDEAKNLTKNTFTKTNYTFTGWNTKADGSGTNYTDEQSVKNLATSGEITLYAKWQGNPYTIAFNANTGTGSMSSLSARYGETYTLPANAFTKKGYTFTGWNTKADGSGTNYADEDEVTSLAASGTVTLYAKWNKFDVIMKYSDNDASLETDLNDNYLYYNILVQKKNFTILKVDDQSSDPLQGAEFTLTGTSTYGNTVNTTITTGANGQAVFNNIEYGTYTLTESQAPTDYKENSTEYTVTVGNTVQITGLTGNNGVFTIENELARTYSDLKVSKKVTGNMADINKTFAYTINFTKLDASKTYQITGTPSSFTTDSSGNATVNFNLTHNTDITFKDLPEKATYKVTETGTDYIPTYNLVSDGSRGEPVFVTQTATGTSNNNLATSVETIDRTDGNVTVKFTNNYDSEIETGFFKESKMPLIVIIVSALTLVIFVIVRVRVKEV